MSVRYTSTFYSLNGTQWRVDITDSDHVGGSSNVELWAPGFKIEYNDQGDEKYDYIKTSSCMIYCQNNDAAFDTFISDLIGAAEQRFQVAIYRAGVIWWAGNILSDLISVEDIFKPTEFSIKATDGLGMLKEVPFDNAGTLYTGREDFIDFLTKIITKTATSAFWSTDPILKTRVNWYDAAHDAASNANDPLLYTDLDHAAFHEQNDEEVIVAMSTYEVIDQICGLWDARFMLSGGFWWLISLNEMDNNTNTFRKYNISGTQTIDSNLDLRIINQDRLTGGVYNYFPQFKKVKKTYTYKQSPRNNLLPVTSDYYATEAGFGEIEGGKVLILKGNVTAQYDDGGGGDETFALVYSVKFSLRNGTDYYFKWDNRDGRETMEWTTTNTDRLYIREMPGYVAHQDDDIHTTLFICITPPVPAGADGNDGYLQISTAIWDDQDDVKAITGSITIINQTLSIKVDYTDGLNEDGAINYEVLNTTDGVTAVTSSIVAELPDVILGDGKNKYTISRLRAKPVAGSYTNSTLWKIGGAGTGYAITMLAIREIMARYKVFTKKYNGTFINTGIYAHSVLVFDSVKYLLNGGSYDPYMEEWDGEWFELGLDNTNIKSENAANGRKISPYTEMSDVSNQLSINTLNIYKVKKGIIVVKALTTDSTLIEADADKWIQLDSSAGALTIDLPTIGNVNNITYQITVMDFTNPITLGGNASNINGSGTFEFSALYETIRVRSDGSNWIIV